MVVAFVGRRVRVRPEAPAAARGHQPRRPDIQGLRAVAVIMVALNHAGMSWLPGGYVGVDVFFVVSGFVITQSLRGRENRDGISIGNFYAARARRILPMSTLVLLVTVLCSWRLLDFARAQRVVSDALWAGLFGANIHFSRIGTDYFSSALPPSPLQHYWSLAVEEQFYLVWPVLLSLTLFGLAAFGRRHRTGRRREDPIGRVLAVLAVLIAASLTWSIVQTNRVPTAAYFSTFTRAWELAVGAALALVTGALAELPAGLRVALSWAGVLGVAAACVLITASTAFPGYAALLPVLSSAAIIAGGTGWSSGGASALLGLAPLQRIGNASYSFYLWHWPVLVIAEGRVGHPLSTQVRLALLAAALALSFVTYRWVETPLRTSTWFAEERGRSLALWPLAASLLVISCVFVSENISDTIAARTVALAGPGGVTPPVRTAVALTSAQLSAVVEASARAARAKQPIPTGLSPNVTDISHDFDAPYSCISQPPTTTNAICNLGDPNGTRTVVVAGDSHAMQWLPAIEQVARAKGWKVVPMIKIYCVAADMKDTSTKNAVEEDECTSWQHWMLPTIAALHPDQVVLANFMQGTHPQTWQRALASTATTLARTGTRVTILSDPPPQHLDPSTCLLEPKATMDTCSTAQTAISQQMRQAAQNAARSSGVSFVDLTGWFCADGVCPSVMGTTVAFRDNQHVSKTYSLEVADALGRLLQL